MFSSLQKCKACEALYYLFNCIDPCYQVNTLQKQLSPSVYSSVLNFSKTSLSSVSVPLVLPSQGYL